MRGGGSGAITYRLLPAGDRAITIEFGASIDPAHERRVRRLDARLAERPPPGLVETIPTYRSLQAVYDPCAVAYDDFVAALEEALAAVAADDALDEEPPPARSWIVPVAYGGAHGEDLAATAAELGLSAEGLARAHAAARYRVAMIGFQPGFAYLSGLPEALHASRFASPRAATPAGSVSIGGVQAAVSSVVAPSAWRLLGRTPARPFDPARADPFLFRPGDGVRFEPIDADAFAGLEAAVASGAALGARLVEASP